MVEKMTKRAASLLCALIMIASMIAIPPTAKATKATKLKVEDGTAAGYSLGWFMIETASDMGRVLNIKANSPFNGGKLITYTKDNATNERFEVIYKGRYGEDEIDYFLIKAMHSGYYLHRSNDGAEHKIVHQWNDYNNPNAHWSIEVDGDYWRLENRNGGYMEVSGRWDNQVWLSGRKDTSSAQKWRFISTSTKDNEKRSIENAWYTIESAFNSKRVLDIENGRTDDGANLLTWDKGRWNNQLFLVEYCNGCSGYYTIKARHSEKYLHKSGSGNGLDIHQWSGIGDNAQWCLEPVDPAEPVGEGYYYLRNKNGGYMTADDDGKSNYVHIQNLKGIDQQKWRFIRANV